MAENVNILFLYTDGNNLFATERVTDGRAYVDDIHLLMYNICRWSATKTISDGSAYAAGVNI